MSRELIDNLAAYQAAIDRLLALPARRIDIYDEDLRDLHLERPTRLSALKAAVSGLPAGNIRLLVRHDAPLRINPALLGLLATRGHAVAAWQTPEHLAHLRDSMILLDDRHALIRFDRDQPRAKLLIDEADELRPYLARFAELVNEGGTPVTATPLGL